MRKTAYVVPAIPVISVDEHSQIVAYLRGINEVDNSEAKAKGSRADRNNTTKRFNGVGGGIVPGPGPTVDIAQFFDWEDGDKQWKYTSKDVVKRFNESHSHDELLTRYGYEDVGDGRWNRPGGTGRSVESNGEVSRHFSNSHPMLSTFGKRGTNCWVLDSFALWAMESGYGDARMAIPYAATILGMDS